METRKAKTRTVAMVVLCVCGILAYALIATGGSLEPSAPPGPTMKTLDEIYNKPIWNMLDKEFVDWPNNPRFAVCDDGTPADESDDMVLDKETGLIWARNANLPGEEKTLLEASEYCHRLKLGGRMGWRLPTIEELSSLVDTSTQSGLPPVHPFKNVMTETYPYWSSTARIGDHIRFWNLYFLSHGWASHFGVLNVGYVWPVRGGTGRISGEW